MKLDAADTQAWDDIRFVCRTHPFAFRTPTHTHSPTHSPTHDTCMLVVCGGRRRQGLGFRVGFSRETRDEGSRVEGYTQDSQDRKHEQTSRHQTAQRQPQSEKLTLNPKLKLFTRSAKCETRNSRPLPPISNPEPEFGDWAGGCRDCTIRRCARTGCTQRLTGSRMQR